jgi:hypothetical protein
MTLIYIYRFCILQPPLLHIMLYSLKPDNDVFCQCGCIVKKYYMPKHLQTIKHANARVMQGRDHIEVVVHRYKLN